MPRPFPALLRAARWATSLIAPADCAACGDDLGHSDAAFCTRCHESKAWLRSQVDDLPALSLGAHDGPLRGAVHRLKYRRRPDLAPRLGRALSPLCVELADGAPVVALVPVPLHPLRLAARGYNQAALLARGAATRRSSPAPLLLRAAPRALRRARVDRSQVELGGLERRRNPCNAFVAVEKLDVPVILIDDVRTTGATALACSTTLLATGTAVLGLVTLTTASSRVEASHRRDAAADTPDLVDRIA